MSASRFPTRPLLLPTDEEVAVGKDHPKAIVEDQDGQGMWARINHGEIPPAFFEPRQFSDGPAGFFHGDGFSPMPGIMTRSTSCKACAQRPAITGDLARPQRLGDPQRGAR